MWAPLRAGCSRVIYWHAMHYWYATAWVSELYQVRARKLTLSVFVAPPCAHSNGFVLDLVRAPPAFPFWAGRLRTAPRCRTNLPWEQSCFARVSQQTTSAGDQCACWWPRPWNLPAWHPCLFVLRRCLRDTWHTMVFVVAQRACNARWTSDDRCSRYHCQRRCVDDLGMPAPQWLRCWPTVATRCAYGTVNWCRRRCLIDDITSRLQERLMDDDYSIARRTRIYLRYFRWCLMNALFDSLIAMPETLHLAFACRTALFAMFVPRSSCARWWWWWWSSTLFRVAWRGLTCANDRYRVIYIDPGLFQ